MAERLSHLDYLRLALNEAHTCVPTPTAFCVGAVIVDDSTNKIIATGYSRELPGNTHAEQNCLTKLLSAEAKARDVSSLDGPVGDEPLDDRATCSLYTTMEPCSERLSGNMPCTDSILRYNDSADRKLRGLGKIKTVYVGVKEPQTFIMNNVGQRKLASGGVDYIYIEGLEKDILEAAQRQSE
ncbi:cytidine deaminase-like protein [Kalaharituber pfeilii]|nr:cytidine deaminase-like protein [Kalaharituber pfeilii]